MQFSIARERYTPLLSSPRNFDGIVSRFLASRVCSKVPVKAKAHVVSRSRRGGQSTWGGGVGGAPPPQGGFANAKYPTTPHSATRNPHLVPLRWRADDFRAQNHRVCWAFRCGRVRALRAGNLQGPLQRGDLHALFQFRRPRGTPWEGI